MLSPEDRTLLVDLLAPPEPGFLLERAIATTFTLQLTAVLPIPLGLAGADLSSSTDPLSILQALRNYSDRIDIFCQAGHVAVPSQRNDLLPLLEQMVHQVKAPSPGHLFHPKLWVLWFVNDDGDERYRLVCGSRNLTHDRAWDVVISLEGRRTLQRRAVNRPIAEFVASLAGRVRGLSVERKRGIAALAQGLRYVEWDRPENVIADKDWLYAERDHSRRNIRTRSDVHVATPHPKKSVSSVQIGQPIANAEARIGQSSGSRAASRRRASASNSP